MQLKRHPIAHSTEASLMIRKFKACNRPQDTCTGMLPSHIAEAAGASPVSHDLAVGVVVHRDCKYQGSKLG